MITQTCCDFSLRCAGAGHQSILVSAFADDPFARVAHDGELLERREVFEHVQRAIRQPLGAIHRNVDRLEVGMPCGRDASEVIGLRTAPGKVEAAKVREQLDDPN